jgi:hypothetical protein
LARLRHGRRNAATATYLEATACHDSPIFYPLSTPNTPFTDLTWKGNAMREHLGPVPRWRERPKACSTCRSFYTNREFSTELAVSDVMRGANNSDGTVRCRGCHILKWAVRPYKQSLRIESSYWLHYRRRIGDSAQQSRNLVCDLERDTLRKGDPDFAERVVTLEFFTLTCKLLGTCIVTQG